MFEFNPHGYGPQFAELLVTERDAELGPGQPNRRMFDKLRGLTAAAAFAPAEVTDQDMAGCCLAGVWLLHNFLSESHSLSQEIHTRSGSYWHGLMHRREPDFPNAKYWFRMAGAHPIHEPLYEAATTLASRADLDIASGFLATQSSWDAERFVDLCEAVMRGRSDAERLCRRIQQIEWQLLFDHCHRQAVQ